MNFRKMYVYVLLLLLLLLQHSKYETWKWHRVLCHCKTGVLLGLFAYMTCRGIVIALMWFLQVVGAAVYGLCTHDLPPSHRT